jgi:hypothetical protein
LASTTDLSNSRRVARMSYDSVPPASPCAAEDSAFTSRRSEASAFSISTVFCNRLTLALVISASWWLAEIRPSSSTSFTLWSCCMRSSLSAA